MGDSETIAVGGRTIVTWLTPYWDLWQTHVGTVSGGRLAKALTPPRKLLGDAACLSAFPGRIAWRKLTRSPGMVCQGLPALANRGVSGARCQCHGDAHAVWKTGV